MVTTHDELRRAVALTWQYVDVVAEGGHSRFRSRLPASPEAVERAVALVLATTRDPIGRVALVRVAPQNATALLADDTPSMLERVLRSLPEFLTDEEAALRTEFDTVAGITLSTEGYYDVPRTVTPELSANLPLVERYMAVERRVSEERIAIVARARAVRFALAESPPAGKPSGTGGCMLLLILGALATALGCAVSQLR